MWRSSILFLSWSSLLAGVKENMDFDQRWNNLAMTFSLLIRDMKLSIITKICLKYMWEKHYFVKLINKKGRKNGY